MNPVSPSRRRSSAPASHRHLVPRWCISANLRSLVLPLSFLPASPLVFPSPFPSHPPPPALSLSSRRMASRSSPSSVSLVLEDTWNGGAARGTEEQSIPGPFGRPYRLDLIGSIRYSVATMYIYVYAPMCFCVRVGVLTPGISLGIVRLAGLRRINPYLASMRARAPDAFVPIKKEMETSGSGFCLSYLSYVAI